MAIRLPRPIRRWLRKRAEAAATLKPAASSSSSSSSAMSSSGGSSRNMRLVLPAPVLGLLLVFTGAIAVAEVVRAIAAAEPRQGFVPPGPVGGLYTVFLLGGPYFIGTLEAVERGTVILSDVFYVQAAGGQLPVLPGAAQPPPDRGSRLVRRKEGDWHQPDRMAIPIERILLMESVGRDSLVAKLVSEGTARQSGAR